MAEKNNEIAWTAAFEDARLSNPVGEFAWIVSDAIADLEATLNIKSLDTETTTVHDEIGIVTSVEANHIKTPFDENHDAEFVSDDDRVYSSVREQISIIWRYDNEYSLDTVSPVDENGTINIDYDDGDEQCCDISAEIWTFCDLQESTRLVFSTSVTKNVDREKPMQDTLSLYATMFGNEAVQRYQAQEMKQFPLVLNSYS